MKIGKTIVSEREKAVSESERLVQRKKEEKRKRFSIAIFFAGLALVGVVIFGFVMKAIQDKKKEDLPDIFSKTYTPTVEIIDEAGAEYITDKIKTTVGMLEEDLQEYGYKVAKVIVPAKTAREIDVYIEKITPYFKVHVDRNTAGTAEDIKRMIDFLDKKNKKPNYVDVRLAGRAYYK